MNRCLDSIQIWYGCSPGIFDDLINFWDESIKTKWLRNMTNDDGNYRHVW